VEGGNWEGEPAASGVGAPWEGSPAARAQPVRHMREAARACERRSAREAVRGACACEEVIVADGAAAGSPGRRGERKCRLPSAEAALP